MRKTERDKGMWSAEWKKKMRDDWSIEYIRVWREKGKEQKGRKAGK